MTPADIEEARRRNLARVEKLIALAKSPNENEARSSAALAVRLINAHEFKIVDPEAKPAPLYTPPPGFGGFGTMDPAIRRAQEAVYARQMRDFMDAMFETTERARAPSSPPRYYSRRRLSRDEIRTCQTCRSRLCDGQLWFFQTTSSTAYRLGFCETCLP